MLEAVVDTNFVIAVMFKDHEYHERALIEWSKLEKAYLPLISITELAYFIINNKLNFELIDEVINDPKIEIVPETIDDVYCASSNNGEIKGYDDFNDFLILSVSVKLNLPLLTFDKKLKAKSDRSRV
ncbi:PIN domain nuclease [Sulfodiicoccus acidiphilus]|uniref:PIN domain nuclease n=1 Tax=Sulfodiicoccus acidiphilus TaxID=1670455 RepID=A0A348B1Z1_9CREN|nr:PIN domain-containing protein [Sulfodiicoccus acidiphilus]BBD72193.1 PIN domain nuclease [Sulfodiicoccus acidiphilus]GGT94314.1 PIN domain nuclease [Sulfodiicoccus acidiphilus]